MKPHPRIRKTIKWSGAAVTLLLVVVWIGSGWFFVSRIGPNGIISNYNGTCDIVRLDPPISQIELGWHFQVIPTRAMHDRFQFWFRFAAKDGNRLVQVPLWALIPIPLALSFLAWQLDAMARADAAALRCPRCGLDRTGLPLLAECPECGSGNPHGKLRPIRAAVVAHGFNALLVAAVAGIVVVLVVLARALW